MVHVSDGALKVLMPDSEPIIVVGAGPAGLSVAACLARRGARARVIDRSGQPGGAYREVHDALQLASPTRFNALPGLPLATRGEYTGAPEYRDYLRRYAAHHHIDIEPGNVEAIARAPGGFRVTVGGDAAFARAVVVATGMWSYPVMPSLDIANIEVPYFHAQKWRGVEAHPGETVLVIGAGMTGVEIAEEAARAGRRVLVSVRGRLRLAPQRLLGVDVHHFVTPLERIPVWLARRRCEGQVRLPATDLGFSALRRSGRIEVVPATVRIAGRTAHCSDGRTSDIDLAIAATGYRWDTPFLPAEVARTAAGRVRTRACESVTWPHLFVVGTPCAARLDSQFLRGMARDAEHVAARLA